MNVRVSVEPVRPKAIEAFRDAYRRELNCQIVHDSHHERGFLRSHFIYSDGVVAGYGSINADETIKEFYVLPELRAHSLTLFQALLAQTEAKAIESQSNDPLLMPMVDACAIHVTSDTILFADEATTRLKAAGANLRKLRWYERHSVFPHTIEPVGNWAIEYERQVVATGGLFFHYNRPYGDIYMEVAPAFRRRGFGSFLVQELKRIARDGGHIPAARCSADNEASQATLCRAGMRPCGRIFRGSVAA